MSIESMSKTVFCVTGIGTDSAKDITTAPRTLLEYIMNFFSFGGIRSANERKHNAFIQAFTNTLDAHRRQGEIPEIMTVTHSGYTIIFTQPGQNNQGGNISVTVEKKGKKAEGEIQSSIYHNVCKSLLFRSDHSLSLPSPPLTNEGKIDLRNIKLSKASLAGEDLTNMDLSGAELAKADLSGANLTGSLLIGTNLFQANLSNTNLYGASFSRANLSETRMCEANLGTTDFTGADLKYANLNAVTGSDTNFSHAKAPNITLGKANLVRANFSNADLSKASVIDAKLSKATLHYINLRGAILSGSDLTDASLTGSQLKGAETKGTLLTGTLLDKDKPMPVFTITRN